MPTRGQDRREEIGKENQLQAACLWNKREKIWIVPLVISAFGGGIKEILKELEKMFEKDDLREKIVAEMLKEIFMDSEANIQRVLPELVQSDWINSS